MDTENLFGRRQGIAILLVIVCSGSIALAGWFVGSGIERARSHDRYVTVKGLAEMEVTADRAVWPITFVATDDQLDTAQSAIRQDTREVRRFLADHGLEGPEVELQDLHVTDQLTQAYRSGPVDSRYIIRQTLVVRTDDVQAVRSATQDIGTLLSEGVVLGGEGYRPGPSFLFTGLNEIKPEMIATATANARDGARQFAEDAGSRVGSIRRANQGVFQILPADGAQNLPEESHVYKTVRAVVTLDYYLED
ncbi:MAG: SIMPL domain-containing protein [Alkalispirochaeta sp.]